MSTQRTITERELLENLGWVRGLARRLVGSESDDLVQQVCVAALDRGRIRQADSPGAAGRRVRAWLARATVYLASNQRRSQSRRRERERSQARPEAQPSTHDVVERNSLLIQVVKAVDALPEPYRTTVLLRYLDGLPTRDIARQTDVTEAVVRKRLSRGLSTLRTQLGHQGVDGRALSALLSVPGLAASVPAAASPTLGVLTMGMTATKVVAGVVAAGAATVILIETPDTRSQSSPQMEESEPVETQVAVAPQGTSSAKVDLSPTTTPATRVPNAETESQRQASRRAVAPPTSNDTLDLLQQRKDAEAQLQNQLEMMQALDQLMARQDELGAVLPADGHLVLTYEDGSQKAAGMIVDGHRDGEWSEWHPNGALEARGDYFAGMRHGAWTFWDSEGAQTLRGEFRYDEEEGTIETLDGALHTVSEYRNGEKHGSNRQTRPNGEVALEDEWYRGKRHGLARSYHPNGQLASEGFWEHGSRIGRWNYWNEAGELDEERSGLVEPPKQRAELAEMREKLESQLRELETSIEASF